MATIHASPVIEHPAAYERAVKARILANAYKTWAKNTTRYQEIEEFLNNKGKIYKDLSPYSMPSVSYKDNFAGSLAKALDTYGKLSEKQCAAVLKVIDDQAQKKAEYKAAVEAQKEKSEFLGVANEKVSLKLKVDAIIALDAVAFSYYDSRTQYLVLMSDEEGNRVVYKSKTVLAYKFKMSPELANYHESIYIKAGMTVYIDASIKALVDYKGEKQTIIQRPKIKGLEYVYGTLRDDIDKRA